MDISTLQDLRALVKSRRKDLGLSQGALADRAGVSRRWVSMFETGHENAEVGRLLAVLEALGLRLLAVANDAIEAGEVAESAGGLRDALRDYGEGQF